MRKYLEQRDGVSWGAGEGLKRRREDRRYGHTHCFSDL
jgi:hypothetical protein